MSEKDATTTDAGAADAGNNNGAGDSVSKAEYEKAIARAHKFEAQLTDFEKKLERYQDIDPDKYKAVVEDYENLRKKHAEGKPEEIDKLIKQKEEELKGKFQKQYGGQLDELQNKTTHYEKELKELRVTSKVMSEAGKYIQPSSIKLLKPFIERDCHYEDGEIVIQDEKGDTRMSPTNPRIRMTLDEYLQEFAEDNGISIDKSKRGTLNSVGQQSNGNYGGSISLDKFAAMQPSERAQLDPKVKADLEDQMLGLRPQRRAQAFQK
jgi:hypothetical protein